ncbi:helix-turn-helix domain-containing protein [Williamsia sp. CHRR-6]|uniref:helix-turn-helix domain-containing protein n=1 Tax=Williamsia sp. CHRR-6 TaxID=2835871 RepID=UPI002024EF8E|nr:XRE family transcriptional regulator [Williamsia sp. CHRR-6]
MSGNRDATAFGRTGGVVDDDPGLFARRLEELFRTVPGPNGRAYSAKAIAARSTERGFRLGESYLSQLRSGKAKSPSFRTVEGIAAAFGVDVHYFLEDRAAQRTRDEIDRMRLQADTSVQLTAFRLAGLSSDAVFIVNELIRVLRVQQGLPEDPPDLPTGTALVDPPAATDPASTDTAAAADRSRPGGLRAVTAYR